MERLTYFKDGYWRVNFSGVQYQADFVDRLAAYEDTGLTPEEIKAPFTEDAMINLAAQALGVEPSRLRELAEADKDGRVVVMPPENYDWKIRGDIALGIITANCRRAEADRAMKEMGGKKDG